MVAAALVSISFAAGATALPLAAPSRSARETIARRSASFKGWPDRARTPTEAKRAAIWPQLAPVARRSRKKGRNSKITRCTGRGPSGPVNAAANRPASFVAVFFEIIHSGCHGLPSAATARNTPQQFRIPQRVAPCRGLLLFVSFTPVHLWMTPTSGLLEHEGNLASANFDFFMRTLHHPTTGSPAIPLIVFSGLLVVVRALNPELDRSKLEFSAVTISATGIPLSVRQRLAHAQRRASAIQCPHLRAWHSQHPDGTESNFARMRGSVPHLAA